MDLLVRGLAVWRLSEMLVDEDGPLGMFRELRSRTGITYQWVRDDAGDGAWKVSSFPRWNPLHCVYCTSVWVGLALTLLTRKVSAPLALSAIAVLIKDGSDRWL